jgi:ER membrane protein complex subunit 1
MLGYHKLKVTILGRLDGAKQDSYTIASDSELASLDSILFTGANTAAPLLAWTDKASKLLKIHSFASKHTSSFNIENKSGVNIEKIAIHAPSRIGALPHFLVHYQTSGKHWAEVYHIDTKKSTVTKAYDLPLLAGKGAFTVTSIDANVYFTRITEDEILIVSSASHGILARWPLRLNAHGFDNVYAHHAISEVVARSSTVQALRSAILLSNGTWVMVRNGEIIWERPEYLAGISTAVWADYPEETALAHELELEGHQNILGAYIHRVKRHIKDLRYLPDWLQHLPERVISSFAGNPSISKADQLGHDSFGFHKIVIALSEDGWLYGLDSGDRGKRLWTSNALRSAGHELSAPRLIAQENGVIEVVDPGLKDTPFAINASTGKQITIDQTVTAISNRKGTRTYRVRSNVLEGYINGDDSNVLWQFEPTPGETIQQIHARPEFDPVASIGKVLGDRKVLYKYLNPNLVLVTAINVKKNELSLYLLDSVSGDLLYTTNQKNVEVGRAVAAAVSENWIVYSYTVSPESESRGHQIVIAELFESALPDDRGPLGPSTNFSSIQPSRSLGDTAKPHVLSQTYHVPEEILEMSVTLTKQGITSRQLLVTLSESKSIVGIPRYVLDPRRPVGREPTKVEAEEGLTKYAPVIEFDPKWYLNHKQEIYGIKSVITSPSLLESTSLVFAYGLDVFGTRVTPSFSFDVLGKDFNKLTMSVTVAALAVVNVFVAPIVRY